MNRWRSELYPHSGRFLVSDDYLEGFGTASIGSFGREEDADKFAEARNAWEKTAPRPEDFGGCEPFPKPDRYEYGRAIFDSDPAERTRLNTYVFRSEFDGSVRIVFSPDIEDAKARLPWPRLHQWKLNDEGKDE